MGHSSQSYSEADNSHERESEMRKRMNYMEETLSQAIRRWEESGDLQRLRGQPIDLSDDSPDWFATRLLKNEDMSHPLIERGRDVEAIRNDAGAVAGRLRALDRRLGRQGDHVADARAFNQLRASLLDEYRRRLYALDRAILDLNLTVPEVLHKRRIRVDEVVEQLAAEVPPLRRVEPPSLPTRTSKGVWARITARIRWH